MPSVVCRYVGMTLTIHYIKQYLIIIILYYVLYRFEKYISGKYLGEVVRVVMKSLVDKGLLFAAASKELFPAPWKFGTDNVSHIEE